MTKKISSACESNEKDYMEFPYKKWEILFKLYKPSAFKIGSEAENPHDGYFIECNGKIIEKNMLQEQASDRLLDLKLSFVWDDKEVIQLTDYELNEILNVLFDPHNIVRYGKTENGMFVVHFINTTDFECLPLKFVRVLLNDRSPHVLCNVQQGADSLADTVIKVIKKPDNIDPLYLCMFPEFPEIPPFKMTGWWSAKFTY